MVVPEEILHVLHAKSLRKFLLAECSRVLILDPADIWFTNTLQGVVLLLAERKERSRKKEAEVAVVSVESREMLGRSPESYFKRADYRPGSSMNGKWMLALLSWRESLLLRMLENHGHISFFDEVADAGVGIVTGANKFFLVPDATVEEYSLEPWAHPMFGRSEHVRGVVYDLKCHKENRCRGLPTNFIWFKNEKLDDLPERVQKYIAMGEAQELHRRYKCRIRTPWYAVPHVYTSSAGMLKRCHHFPRLILNRAKAYTTDTAYRVRARPKGASAAKIVFCFVNSLTALTAELEGRHYGGGVLELVPSEIERLLIPIPKQPRGTLAELDADVKAGTPPEELLARQDSRILRPLGIKQADCELLRAGWTRLRQRRQRSG